MPVDTVASGLTEKHGPSIGLPGHDFSSTLPRGLQHGDSSPESTLRKANMEPERVFSKRTPVYREPLFRLQVSFPDSNQGTLHQPTTTSSYTETTRTSTATSAMAPGSARGLLRVKRVSCELWFSGVTSESKNHEKMKKRDGRESCGLSLR